MLKKPTILKKTYAWKKSILRAKRLRNPETVKDKREFENYKRRLNEVKEQVN